MADALHDSTETLRLSDWLARYVSSETVLIGDSGSLIALIATLQAAQGAHGRHFSYRTLSKYPDSSEDIELILDDVLSRDPDAKLVFVISVNSSGRLIGLIRAVAPDCEIVVIVDTSESTSSEKLNALATIPVERFPVGIDGRCEACQGGIPIRIDARTYERIPYFEFKRVKIDLNVAGLDREFWTAADQVDAVYIHHDILGNDGLVRHHAVYIDIAKLLTNAWFREKAREQLRQIPRPNLVVVPEHSVAQAIIDLVQEVFGPVRALRVPMGRFSQEIVDAVGSVPDTGCVLIADDGLVEGTTLLGLKHEYYRITQDQGRQGPRLEAFVCLARPETDAIILNKSRPYRDALGHHLRFAHKVLLPGSNKLKCPWCVEETFLSRLAPRISEEHRSELGRRRQVLATRDISPPIFDTQGLKDGLETEGAFFGTLGKRAGFAATSSAALLVRQKLNVESQFNVVAILDVPMAISCYFDSPLLSGILRTLERRHLVALADEEQLIEVLLGFPTDRAYPGLIGELAWAAINNKLPRDPIRRLLDKIPETPDVSLLRLLLTLA